MKKHKEINHKLKESFTENMTKSSVKEKEKGKDSLVMDIPQVRRGDRTAPNKGVGID